MNLDKFLDSLRTILIRAEDEIKDNPDFMEEDIPMAINGIRYVNEYVSHHKNEIEELVNKN